MRCPCGAGSAFSPRGYRLGELRQNNRWLRVPTGSSCYGSIWRDPRQRVRGRSCRAAHLSASLSFRWPSLQEISNWLKSSKPTKSLMLVSLIFLPPLSSPSDPAVCWGRRGCVPASLALPVAGAGAAALGWLGLGAAGQSCFPRGRRHPVTLFSPGFAREC